MPVNKTLIVEDDPNLLETLIYNLRKEGYSVVAAADGEQAVSVARKEKPDLIILDVMLPKMSGFEVCRILRKEMTVPILMLTAKADETDKVVGLEIGADDYMTKPFSFDELIARLRSVKRRALVQQENNLQVADLTLDPASREVLRGETRVTLTRTEYNLLERLMYRAGKVVSRRSLIEAVWGFDREIEENTLDAFMHLLRNKIDPPGRTKLIHTVRGIGYMIRPDSSSGTPA